MARPHCDTTPLVLITPRIKGHITLRASPSITLIFNTYFFCDTCWVSWGKSGGGGVSENKGRVTLRSILIFKMTHPLVQNRLQVGRFTFLECRDLCVCEGQIPLENVPWGWIDTLKQLWWVFYFGRLPYI
jgi:hypothetical protein